jgi:acetylornithine/N-succinyldiaminopimelate aminotransferase
MSHLMNTYARLPVAFSHGDGSWVTDTEGKVYLDALSGIAVSTLGHNHPLLVAAIAAQAGRLLHSSNLYRIPQQEQLADKLAALSGMDEVFFCNSGCEANEAAIKLARLYGHQQGVDSPATIVMEKAFHGRTMATLSATGSRKAQAGFEPLVSGFVRVPTTTSRRSGRLPVQQEHRRGDARDRPGRGRHQQRRCRFSSAVCARSATIAAGC